jgi:hypothetical protein
MTATRRVLALVLGGIASWASPALADQFDQLDGPFLARTLRGTDLTSRPNLTVADIAAMPSLLRDNRSALALARTGLGNPARMLLRAELIKPAGGQGEPIPVVVFERLDTFDAADPSARLASRREVVLFDRFLLDLDTSQVVPEGQGGDLVYRVDGELGPRIEPVGEAKLFTFAKPPAFDNAKVPRPTPGKLVVPADFAGRYQLFADGQWSGTLDLKVEEKGAIVGQFRSDRHGTTYSVSGQVSAEAAKKVFFAIKYPRARQEFEGYLWAEGKGAIAGVASLNERPAGFFAIREGGRYAPDNSDLAAPGLPEGDRSIRHEIELGRAGLTLDGKPVTFEALAESLKVLATAKPDQVPLIVIRAGEGREAVELVRVVQAVHLAGLDVIHLETK